MKRILNLFKNKVILTLMISLVAVVGVIVYLVVDTYINKDIYAIDFSTLNEDEIIAWYSDAFGNTDNLDISYVYDEEIEKDKMISQSVKVDEIIDENGLKIVFSNGIDPSKEIDLPNFVLEEYTKEIIEKFFEDNHFSDISYEYELSNLPKDTVIKVNVEDKAKRDDLIMVTLSVGDDVEQITVVVPDFKDYTLKNAKAWGNNNSITIKVNYIFSDIHVEGAIISQDKEVNSEIKGGSTVTLQVSNGKGIAVVDLSKSTLAEAKKWCDDNGLKYDIIYQYHDSVEENYVINNLPKAGTLVAKGSVIKIYISKGIDPANIKVKVDNKVGSSESDFLKYISTLGLNTNKGSASYSDKIAKDLILSHTTGEVKMSDVINYNLSLGAYKIDVNAFEGKLKSKGDEVISKANALNAGVKLVISEKVNSDIYPKDTLFGCIVDGKTVSCKLSKGPLMTVDNFVGQKITSNFVKDGVNYIVIIDTNYTDGSEYGVIYKQSKNAGDRVESGTSVELYAYKGEESKAYIDSNFDIYHGFNLEETLDRVNTSLGVFNLTINYQKDPNITKGYIISIKVNGNSYNSGLYPLTSKVVVTISDGFEE